ncbi:PLP-dependent aminotransferase family protein [Paenibacillus thailandensis]|uniref:PLP-dependent aminotransferase family protein n=1 Tax=Paenibacillus thailandensis TaxID=393250 RepID=A0ABW5R2Y0_9BACL
MTYEWRPDKRSNIPLHRQIYEWMKGRIAAGEWPVGMKIPVQRELAAKLGVNRSTVVYALGELAAEGWIESRVGQGTFVANNTWSLLASAPPPDWNRYAESGAYRPNLATIQQINKAEANPAVVRLGTGELSPDLLPSEQMKEAFSGFMAERLTLGYPEPKGLLYLRESVSAYLRTKGIEASPASILIVSGALQGLQLISLGLLERGSALLTENPTYLNSLHVFQSAGIRFAGLPMDGEGVVAESISGLKRRHNAAILYTNPSFHNPTGVLMSERRREELLRACALERLPVVEDDAYGELWLDEPPPKPLKARDEQGLVLYMGTVSKTLGPGLRIGWIAGPEPAIERLADIKMQTDYGSSSLSQHAVAEWLSGGRYEVHLSRVRDELKRRRDFTLAILERHFRDIADWNKPRGGFYVWLRLTKPVSVQRLFAQALAEGLLLNPGYVYDRSDGCHLRLSYAYASFDQLERGLKRLSHLIRSG